VALSSVPAPRGLDGVMVLLAHVVAR
jgi:hypothetical protein